MAASAPLGSVLSALIGLLFPLALCGVIAREIIAGRNWRNLKVLAGIGALTAAQMAFHLDDARAKIAAWVVDFNTARPHSALDISRRRPMPPTSPQRKA